MQKPKYKQSIYFDADILINYFEDRDRELRKHAREVINRAKRMCENPEIIIKVPLIVLGELTMKTIEDDRINLSDLFGRVINAEFTSGSREIYRTAYELMKKDKRLMPADALLVAQALTDSTSQWLITTDRNLINNLAILKIRDRLESRLNISDRFEKS